MKRRGFRTLFIPLLTGCMLVAGLAVHSGENGTQWGWRSQTETVYAAEASYTTTANLNLRTGPGTQYGIILTMPRGSTVQVTGYSGNWAQVTYGSRSGFAHRDYLQAAPTQSPMGTRYTTANLNLRSGPGTGYAILTTMPRGAAVEVLSTAAGWARVTYNGREGYASESYLYSSPTGGEAPTPEAIRYTTANLNLRSGPGTGYAILTTMPRGAEVQLLGMLSGWVRIRYQGREGYASSSYLSTTPPSSGTVSGGGAALAVSSGNVASTTRRIALTFDDAGSASQVRRLLSILENHGVIATFFPNGDWVERNPALVREIAAKGHSIQSHAYSHPSLTGVSDAELRRQLRLSRDIIQKTTGIRPTLLRPPYGAQDARVRRIAGEEGYRYLVLWSVDTSDWATVRYGITITSDYIVRHTLQNASQNGIVLMHMHSEKMLDALPRMIRGLKDQGYSFVTVNTMLQ